MIYPSFPALRACLLVATLANSTVAADSVWPEFRGPTGDGIARVESVPTEWSAENNVDWRTELPGRAWSSPVVADNVVWLTTAIEEIPTAEEQAELMAAKGVETKKFKSTQVARAIDLRLLAVDWQTGSLLSQTELFRIDQPDPIHAVNSYASPTPVIDGEMIYCHFGTYGTVCLRRQDQSVVWQRRLPLEHGVGPGSSPFIYQDLLVLICDGVDRQFVAALDKQTGETVWETERPAMDAPNGDQKKSYCTPVVAVDKEGREQLICMGSQWLVAYDPASGEELWKVRHGKGFSVVPRPVVQDGVIYVATGFGKPELWAVRIDGRGDVSDSHVLWRQKRGIPAKPSPLLVDDRLYVVSDTGVASCLSAEDGDVIWNERLGGNFSASPLYAAGYLFFANHEGETIVGRPGESFEEVAVNRLPGQIMASPVALDGALLIRTDEALYRIVNGGKK